LSKSYVKIKTNKGALYTEGTLKGLSTPTVVESKTEINQNRFETPVFLKMKLSKSWQSFYPAWQYKNLTWRNQYAFVPVQDSTPISPGQSRNQPFMFPGSQAYNDIR
jgi:hypothetical protein